MVRPTRLLPNPADHRITINKQPVGLQELETRLRGISTGRRAKTMYVAGDGARSRPVKQRGRPLARGALFEFP